MELLNICSSLQIPRPVFGSSKASGFDLHWTVVTARARPRRSDGKLDGEDTPMGLLDGKVTLVTGAGRGAGRAIALRLAREGAAVTLLARSADKLEVVAREIEAEGGRALVTPADVSDAEAVEKAVAATEARFGGLDALINNAGIGLAAPSAGYPLENW